MLKDFIVAKLNLQLLKKGKNIKQLADECEVTRQTMSNLVKKGEGRLELLIKAFDVLEIEIYEKVV